MISCFPGYLGSTISGSRHITSSMTFALNVLFDMQDAHRSPSGTMQGRVCVSEKSIFGTRFLRLDCVIAFEAGTCA